ncbi:N-acetylglucosamine repressor [bacterium BMS3Abin02]|nr:N-acetylglucosamine repressor [bacterium BMS3Abin02]HDL49793.1 ROK family transcriptional regulator [Actinomycetota bacterium]
MLRSPANRRLVRAINRSMVLNVVRESGPISKAEIARSTGLSQATVGAIVPSLIEHGLVSESDPTVTGIGRPATQLQLDRDSYNVVGLKLMEDRIVGAVTDLEARTLGQSELPVAELEPASIVEAAAEVVDDLLQISGLRRERLLGVGIGMAGVIDTNRGLCRNSPFLGWRNVPIGELAEARLEVPVRVDNDVNTLALAERWFGVGQQADDFLLITLGRGVGLSIVAGGNVYRGAQGGAGEFGHTVVAESDELCSCGNRGCLEATVGEPALLRRAQELCIARDLSSPATAAELYAAAIRDQELANLLVRAGEHLGRGISNLINLFAPALVILSGEGVVAGETLLGAVQTELDVRVHKGLQDSYELMVEPLRDEAWARGAASLILDAVFEPPTRSRSVPLWEWDSPP